jgi:hypothetical protein
MNPIIFSKNTGYVTSLYASSFNMMYKCMIFGKGIPAQPGQSLGVPGG